MTRDQFIDLLTRSVRDRLITEAQAIDLLRRFDAGTLDLANLPFGLDAGDEEEQDAIVAVIPFLIAVELLVSSIRSAPRAEQLLAVDEALRSASDAQRLELRELLRASFSDEARRLAPILAGGDVSGWQREMANLITRNAIEQRMVGTGRALTLDELASVEEGVRRQLAFLSKFADEAALAIANGEPFSEAYIANRSTLYGGNGYAEFFKGESVSFLERGLESGSDLSNWVYYYISVDDAGTCGPCLEAEAAGPYGSDDPFIPYPGEVCLGGARCRCSLQLVYDPAAAIEAAARAAGLAA